MGKGRIPKRFIDYQGNIWVTAASYGAKKPFNVYPPGEDISASTKYKAMPYAAAREAFDNVSFLPKWLWSVPG